MGNCLLIMWHMPYKQFSFTPFGYILSQLY
jgi:hypothetical protein